MGHIPETSLHLQFGLACSTCLQTQIAGIPVCQLKSMLEPNSHRNQSLKMGSLACGFLHHAGSLLLDHGLSAQLPPRYHCKLSKYPNNKAPEPYSTG